MQYTSFCTVLGKPKSVYAFDRYGLVSTYNNVWEELYRTLEDYCAVRSAAAAFGFLSWALWSASCALAWLDLKAGKGLRVAGLNADTAQDIQGA